jgi:hypothetical protein
VVVLLVVLSVVLLVTAALVVICHLLLFRRPSSSSLSFSSRSPLPVQCHDSFYPPCAFSSMVVVHRVKLMLLSLSARQLMEAMLSLILVSFLSVVFFSTTFEFFLPFRSPRQFQWQHESLADHLPTSDIA